ncbi:MAG: hypothetical protein ACI8TP_000764 [Acidimicrobiales bacterium]|jgi:hypothetical protein
MRVNELDPKSAAPWTILVGNLAIRFDLGANPTFDRRTKRFLAPAPLTDVDPNHTVSIEAGTAPAPKRPSNAIDDMGAEIELSAASLWLRHGGHVIAGDSSSTRIYLDAASEQCDPYLFIMAFFNRLSLHEGWVPLHSALLQCDQGATMLFGPSGRGKSTTSGAALHAGWAVASDDITFLRSMPCGGIEALGLPRALSIPDEAIPLSLRGQASDSTDHRDRRVIGNFDRCDSWQTVVGSLVVDHGLSPETTVQELKKLEFVQALVRCEAFAARGSDEQARSLEVVEGLTALPAGRLMLGREPSTRIETAAKCLQESIERFADRLESVPV